MARASHQAERAGGMTRFQILIWKSFSAPEPYQERSEVATWATREAASAACDRLKAEPHPPYWQFTVAAWS